MSGPRNPERAGAHDLLPEALEQANELRPERHETRSGHRAARVYDDIPSRRYLRTIEPQDLADPPANSVADHRATERPFHADAEAAALEPVRAIEDQELRARAPLAAAVHGLVLSVTHQASRPRKTSPRVRRVIRWA